jgi:hypothetical protein
LEDGVPGAAEQVITVGTLAVEGFEGLDYGAKVDALLFLEFLLSLGQCGKDYFED